MANAASIISSWENNPNYIRSREGYPGLGEISYPSLRAPGSGLVSSEIPQADPLAGIDRNNPFGSGSQGGYSPYQAINIPSAQGPAGWTPNTTPGPQISLAGASNVSTNQGPSEGIDRNDPFGSGTTGSVSPEAWNSYFNTDPSDSLTYTPAGYGTGQSSWGDYYDTKIGPNGEILELNPVFRSIKNAGNEWGNPKWTRAKLDAQIKIGVIPSTWSSFIDGTYGKPMDQDVVGNFDWTYYVNTNPDLLGAGIDTETEALRHYILHGYGEGRVGGAPEGTERYLPGNAVGGMIPAPTGENEMIEGEELGLFSKTREIVAQRLSGAPLSPEAEVETAGIIDEFIAAFGEEALALLIQEVASGEAEEEIVDAGMGALPGLQAEASGIMAAPAGMPMAPQGMAEIPLPPGLAAGGLINGRGDGVSDSVMANIEGREPVLLSRDEVVIPADAVSSLGNGSSQAGAQELMEMVNRIRAAKNGMATQPPRIDPRKALIA